MPDHFHALVDGLAETSDFQEFVRQFKQQSSFAWRRQRGTALWQHGFYEHILRDEENTIVVARYILANPVRAGLVASPADYPFSGSFVFKMQELLAST